MNNQAPSERLDHVKRKIRLIAILHSAEAVGITPLHIASVHTLAYLADVLAPVWNLPIIDGQVLKRIQQPFFPKLQSDLDALVGRGVVHAFDFSYQRDSASRWALEANYQLNPELADPILIEVGKHSAQEQSLEFVREVVYAASGVAAADIRDLGIADAAYSDPVVDIGGVVSIEEDDGSANATVKVALRFKELTRAMGDLGDSELVHLYVRHLYSRMHVA